MTYAANARTSGREPITLAELDMDFCQNTYGAAPCTAAVGVTGSTYCYNTYATCQDRPNYNRGTRTYRYCTPRSTVPATLAAIPSLRSVSLQPTKIDPSGGLGERATVQLTFQDHPFHDRGLDPYSRERFGGPFALQANALGDELQANAGGDSLLALPASSTTAQPDGSHLDGTYWGRWIARNRYYQGRVLRVLTGYLPDGQDFDAANFITRTYLLEKVSGPDVNGRVTISAHDPLKRADNERSKAPAASTGRLASAIASGDVFATLTPTGIGDEEYPASGWVRMGTEIMEFTRSGDSLTLTRAQFGTEATSHDDDELVQLCLRYEAETVDVILYNLLTEFAGVPGAYIDQYAWEAEVVAYLNRPFSAIISEPTGVRDLIKDLNMSAAVNIWWDERDAEIKLRVLRQPTSSILLDETQEILQDSVAVTDQPDKRITQAWVYFIQRDATEPLDEIRNYRQLAINADLEDESANKFGEAKIRTLYSRWIQSRTLAEEIAENLVVRYGETPRQIAFSVDAKDTIGLWTGDVVNISTRLVQDVDGTNLVLPAQIIEASETDPGTTFRYVCQVYDAVAFQAEGLIITIGADVNSINLLDLFTTETGAPPTEETIVTFVVNGDVIVGASSFTFAIRTDIWPNGAQIRIENNGRIVGRGGRGGGNAGFSGQDGGDALLVEYPLRLLNAGEIWGGGGGGGSYLDGGGGQSGGGGGGGTAAGIGGPVDTAGFEGQDGTATAGGQGRDLSAMLTNANKGGDPGQDGSPASTTTMGGVTLYRGGDSGNAIVGVSLVTFESTGDIRGPQV